MKSGANDPYTHISSAHRSFFDVRIFGMILLSRRLADIFQLLLLFSWIGGSLNPSSYSLSWLTPLITFGGTMISSEQFIQKCRSLARAKNPYLDVADGRVRLEWTTGDESRVDYMERAEVIGLGISYDTLVNAVIEAGGTLDADGHFPLDDAIRKPLQKLLKS